MSGRRLTNKTLDSTSQEVLFLYNASTKTSKIFEVVDKPLRITAYGLREGLIEVKRIYQVRGNVERGDCGELLDSGTSFEKPYRVGCCVVTMTPNNDEIVIDGQGSYRLVYQGESRATLQVTATIDAVANVNDTVRGLCCDKQEQTPANNKKKIVRVELWAESFVSEEADGRKIIFTEWASGDCKVFFSDGTSKEGQITVVSFKKSCFKLEPEENASKRIVVNTCPEEDPGTVIFRRGLVV